MSQETDSGAIGDAFHTELRGQNADENPLRRSCVIARVDADSSLVLAFEGGAAATANAESYAGPRHSCESVFRSV